VNHAEVAVACTGQARTSFWENISLFYNLMHAIDLCKMAGLCLRICANIYKHRRAALLCLPKALAIGRMNVSKPIWKAPPMKVRIHVSLKPGVLDPQGRAVHHALDGLGFAGVEDVRIGRLIELEVADDTSDEALDDMCSKLLANTVIENYQIEKVAA